MYSSILRSAQAIESAQGNAITAVHNISTQQRIISENTKILLMTLSQLPALLDGNKSVSADFLKNVLSQYPLYDNLFVVDLQGRLINSAVGLPEELTDISSRRFFREARRARAFSVGDSMGGLGGEKVQSLHFSYPIMDSLGQMEAIVVASTSSALYSRYFAGSDLSGDGNLCLTDRSGRIIYSVSGQGRFVPGDKLPDKLWQDLEVMYDDRGIFNTLDFDGKTIIVAYQRLRLSSSEWPYLNVILAIPEGEVYGAARQEMYFSLSLLGLALLLALGTVFLVSNFIIMPGVNRLVNTARSLTEGDFNARADMGEQKSELGAVGTALDEMATALQQRTGDLVEAKDRAEDANRAKSEFLANMSHELRTPLNGVLGMLQIMQLSELNREQKESLDTAIYSGRNLLRIINDILDFSKIEAGKLDIEAVPFNLRESCRAVYDIFKPEAGGKGIEFVLHIEDDVPVCLLGDEVRVRQIIFNLIGNAIKFTSQGRVELQISREGREAAEQDFCRTRFVVRDTGIGIASDKLDKIFESFTQADGATTRKYGGTGLGLTIVRRLVELMRGEISMTSQEGKGTTMTVLLPFTIIADQGIAKPADGELEQARDPENLFLLLAEDEPVNRITSTRFLQHLGHRVVHAENGRQALDILTEHPDLDGILMDIQMPLMDGMEATRIIRNSHELRQFSLIPIIALTAHALTGDREKFLQTGMNDYLSKPLNRHELREVLRRVFGGPASGKEIN
ncbi:MAG: response regulator [Desulfarculales bacterium]|nr:response regulator [Desulfarculales bacterium]